LLTVGNVNENKKYDPREVNYFSKRLAFVENDDESLLTFVSFFFLLILDSLHLLRHSNENESQSVNKPSQ